MASVWKHPKSANWFARYRGTAGKTVNRSTGVTDESEARRIATTWEVEAARESAALPRGEVSRNGIADAIVRAERLARQGRLDAVAARGIVNDLLAAAGGRAIEVCSNRKWCEDWRDARRPTVGKRARGIHTHVTRAWLEHLGSKAAKPLELITKADAIAFRDAMMADGYAAHSVNLKMSAVRSMYAEAVAQGLLDRNPFAGIKGLPITHETKRGAFSADEIRRLLKKAGDEWKGIILLAATSGLRLMDCAWLKWQTLDLKSGTISIRPAKNRGRVLLHIPIHPAFRKWLAVQKRTSDAVFPALSQESQVVLSATFSRLMEAAGVKSDVARKAAGTKGRTTRQKTFHSLRHFAATAMASAGVRADVARKITGHTDEAIHANYVGPEMATLRKAVQGIRLG